MNRLMFCVSICLFVSLFLVTNVSNYPLYATEPEPITVSQLEPTMDRKEVTIKFTVSGLGGIAQLAIPGQAPEFIIETMSEQKSKDLDVWIEGELANVLDRLQLSYTGTNPIKKGVKIVATGSLEFLPGTGERKDHEWFTLHVGKWQNFRILKAE